MKATTSMFLEAGNRELQDRVEILRSDTRTVFIVADGAGGISGGAQAADFFVRSVRDVAGRLATAGDCGRFLQTLDQEIARAPDCGETTGIVIVVGPDGMFGASVGDSAAWLFTPDAKQELTAGVPRKPFIGSGAASAHQFVGNSSPSTLVVATDGLWKYTSLELIEQRVRTGEPGRLAAQLADLVRLRSGAFPDDIAIAACRLES